MEVSTKTLKVFKQTMTEPQIIEINEEITLLELLGANNISISQSCGGFGTCTTCRIIIHKNENAFTARTEIETERAQERKFSKFERLACQCQIIDSAEIQIPSTDRK